MGSTWLCVLGKTWSVSTLRLRFVVYLHVRLYAYQEKVYICFRKPYAFLNLVVVFFLEHCFALNIFINACEGHMLFSSVNIQCVMPMHPKSVTS